MEALQKQIECLDATITDLATGDNQDRFVHVTQQRDIFNERLATLKRIHNQNNNESSGTKANNVNSQDALVPRHLPAFQFYGGVRHAKNKARYDSAQSFLEEFRTVLEGHSLNIEQHWRRLMPLTVDSNSRAWLRELIGKEGVNDWNTFCQEIIKQYSPPYTMFYRRYHLRTMRQKSTESLRQYSTKFQEYAVKTGIANNQELVFNYLCSLHRRYRKRSWSLVHHHYGEEVPDELEPIVQLVMTLSSGERAPEDEEMPMSDSSDDSGSDTETSDSDNHRHKRRRSADKGKGKAKSKKSKDGNCPIHRGAGHDEENCNVLKKHVNAALLQQQASSQASSSRSAGFVPRPPRYSSRMKPQATRNMCWHCNKVPFVPGHECSEMRQARARRAQRFNNNVRSRMAHVNNNDTTTFMQLDEDQLDKHAQDKQPFSAPQPSHSHSILVPITIQNRNVQALLDTGADHSLLDIDFAKENKWLITPHTQPGSVIMSMKNHTSKRYGYIKDMPLQYMTRQYSHTFEVLPLSDNVQVTIGLDLMPKLGISILYMD